MEQFGGSMQLRWSSRDLLSVILLGAVAGGRSLSAPATIAWCARGRDEGVPRLIGSPVFRGSVTVLALGEVIADKTPWIPDRTAPAVLPGRLLMGAVAGASYARLREAGAKRIAWAALVGGVAGVASAFVFRRFRRWLAAHTVMAPLVVALGEDATVLALAAAAARPLRHAEDRRSVILLPATAGQG